MKYLFLYRPPMPGAMPREGLQEVGYDEETMNGRHTWGWAVYNRRLTEKEINDYELFEVWEVEKDAGNNHLFPGCDHPAG